MKKVYAARNPGDAHLMKGLLEGEGISAVVQGEFLWVVRGEVPITPETAPSVWVEDSEYERAMELVSAFRSAGPERVNENETLAVRNQCLTRPAHPSGSWAC